MKLPPASSRLRSLFLDRCQELQDSIIRYRLMFIQNGGSAKPLQRDLKDDTLRVLMKLLVSSTEYDDVLLSLRGRLAGRALELLQDVGLLCKLPRCHTHPQPGYSQRRNQLHRRCHYIATQRGPPPSTCFARSSCATVGPHPAFAHCRRCQVELGSHQSHEVL